MASYNGSAHLIGADGTVLGHARTALWSRIDAEGHVLEWGGTLRSSHGGFSPLLAMVLTQHPVALLHLNNGSIGRVRVSALVRGRTPGQVQTVEVVGIGSAPFVAELRRIR